MRASGGGPRRVLVVCCPDWPLDAEDSGPGTRAFEQVVTMVEAFCPQVEVLRPGACALSARGPARYFGGEEALARKITEAIHSHSLQHPGFQYDLPRGNRLYQGLHL